MDNIKPVPPTPLDKSYDDRTIALNGLNLDFMYTLAYKHDIKRDINRDVGLVVVVVGAVVTNKSCNNHVSTPEYPEVDETCDNNYETCDNNSVTNKHPSHNESNKRLKINKCFI